MTESSPLGGHPFARELDLALDLALRGGALALAYQREGESRLAVTEKTDDGGPVTRADIEVDEMICEGLRKAFPGDAILAEESYARDPSSGAGRLDKARCWMIDPVDGTRGFALGESTWAVHIGLSVEGVPTLGVVHEPAEDRTSIGIFGVPRGGAWLRDEHGTTREISVAAVDPARLRLVTSKSHRTPVADEIAAAVEAHGERDLRLGSTGVKIARVARGVADIYAHPSGGTKLWDSCAPQAILHAAGGRLTDFDGAPLRFLDAEISHRRGLLASPRAFHAQLVERMGPFADRL